MFKNDQLNERKKKSNIAELFDVSAVEWPNLMHIPFVSIST